jgi:hypothetical protein
MKNKQLEIWAHDLANLKLILDMREQSPEVQKGIVKIVEEMRAEISINEAIKEMDILEAEKPHINFGGTDT